MPLEPEKVWSFPSNNGGQFVGFNNGAIDHFKGTRLSSTVREVIQNSLDAPKVDEGEPIHVAFKIHRIPREKVPEITSLRPHLLKCKAIAEDQDLENAVKFYQNAINRIDNEKEVKFLAIHDTNSKGLLGPINEPYGAWAALVKGAGLSQKQSNASLGSFGHGSKAPFSLSDVRSIFYLSYVLDDKDDKLEDVDHRLIQTVGTK